MVTPGAFCFCLQPQVFVADELPFYTVVEKAGVFFWRGRGPEEAEGKA